MHDPRRDPDLNALRLEAGTLPDAVRTQLAAAAKTSDTDTGDKWWHDPICTRCEPTLAGIITGRVARRHQRERHRDLDLDEGLPVPVGYRPGP